jgi:hypothetical protein
MSRGILCILWDNRRSADSAAPSESYEELVCSVTLARKEGLPIALLIDTRHPYPYLDRSLFDELISHDFGAHQTPESHALFRKSFMFDLSPFEETLYLDSDCVINDGSLPTNLDYPPQSVQPDLAFGFEKAKERGPCVAYDGHVMGQLEYFTDKATRQKTVERVYPVFRDKVRELLGRSGYLPCFNSGVIFFSKASEEAARIFDLARTYACEHRCNDQVALTIAVEKLSASVCILHDRVWNCRILPGRRLPWPGVKISHNQFWRHYFNALGTANREVEIPH